MLEAIILNNGANRYSQSYQQFLSLLATAKTQEVTASDYPSSRNGYVKFVTVSSRGSIWGSPFNTNVTYDSRFNSITCHAYPNIDLLQYATTNQLYCAMKLQYVGSKPSYISVTRNGLTSTAYGSYGGTTVVDFIYFDSALNKMMRWNPSTNSTPVEFNGVFL